MAIKAVILIGGPNKGQRFRPLSFDSPKFMFHVGGKAIIEHLIESCLKFDFELSEIILLGFYPEYEMQEIIGKLNTKNQEIKHQTSIRYLQESTRLGTAGGLYHFRKEIGQGNPEAFLLINGDVCGDFDFDQLLAQHQATIEYTAKNQLPKPYITVMTTEASRSESQNYGCIVENKENHRIEHYVEKPSTFVSNMINCGAYVCGLELLAHMKDETRDNSLNPVRHDFDSDYLSLEIDILQQSFYQPHCYAYKTRGSWWCQVKTAASAIYANRRYLERCGKINCQEKGNKTHSCTIIGNVFIHPTAVVDSTSVIGPNVSIMANCIIGPGVRIKESIILQHAVIRDHSLILYSIVGWYCNLDKWVRVEGAPNEPDPNQEFAKVQNPPLFNSEGKLTPSISVLGSSVRVASATVILNTIVLPHKEIARSYKNEIVL